MEIKWKNVCSLTDVIICPGLTSVRKRQCQVHFNMCQYLVAVLVCVYLCPFPNTVYLGTSCSNFSLWYPPPIQRLCIYVNILAAVTEITDIVTPHNKFFQYNHNATEMLLLRLEYTTNDLGFTNTHPEKWKFTI